MNDFCILDQFSSTPVMDYIGNSKQKYDWQHLTRSISPVWNSFITNLFTTKPNLMLVNQFSSTGKLVGWGQASKVTRCDGARDVEVVDGGTIWEGVSSSN